MNSSSTWFSELVKTWPREKLLAAAVLKQRGVDLEALFRPATVTASAIPFCPQEPKEKQQAFLDLTCEEALFGGSAGPGKALSVSTPIPTLYGWKTMGELQVGDYVFGRDGDTTPIVAVSAVMHEQECFELAFDDGTTMIADAAHEWLTFDTAELGALTRLDPEWRARRREKRPSRAMGRHGPGKSAAVAARNQRCLNPVKEAPAGTVRTTTAIAATLKDRRGRTNHAIPLAAPLHLLHGDLSIHPYVLGAWLGDGHSSSGVITTADEEVLDDLRACGEVVSQRNGRYAYRLQWLTTRLRKAGLLNDKHVPNEYLWAYTDQRLSLLQGLMDTDGYAATDGQAIFTNTNQHLASSVFQLAASLGLKPLMKEKRAQLQGRDCGPKWDVSWTSHLPVFRLERKRARLNTKCRRTTRFRFIVGARRVPSVPVRCIQVAAEDGLFLAGESMIPTHNSSALLMAALQYVEVPGYAALLLRRTYADLSLPGALMDRLGDWLRPTAARWNNTEKTWVFPSGATITFGYLETEVSKFRYQGAEFGFCGFDELSQFSESQYRYLFSRLRRLEGSAVPMRMRAATNPGADWVKNRFEIDMGREELVQWTADGERAFIPARLSDNDSLDAVAYIRSLDKLDPITRKQLLEGDWDVRPEGALFKREWFEIVKAGPA